MAGNRFLYRRPSGIYVVRIAVPYRHRLTVGKSEIHITTHLRDWIAAKLAALRIQIGWLEYFMALDAGTLSTAEALLQGSGWVSVEEAARIMGISATSLLTELMDSGCDIATYASEWPCWVVDTFSTMPRESDGAVLMNEVEQIGQRRIFSGEVRPPNTAAAISALVATGEIAADIFRHGKYGGLICDTKQTIPTSAILAPKTVVETVRTRLAKHVQSQPKQPSPAIAEGAGDRITSKYGHKRFSELLALFLASRKGKVKESQYRRLETEASRFTELMHDPVLSAIDVETVLLFKSRMAEMPNNTALAGRKSKLKEANALRAYAEKEPIPLKSEKTINGHIRKLAQVFNFAVRNGMMHFSPTTECLRGGSKSTVQRDQDDRSVFDPLELKTIFAASWFKVGKGTDKHWRPYQFWIPLLGLLTGCRINELAQLHLADIKQTASGTWYLDINRNHPGTSVKTANSIRTVPLHKRLVELGLPLYAETLRDLGEARLFPEFRYDESKGFGKAAGAWFNERFLGRKLGFMRDGRKSFHSFRHGFVTALERRDTPERVILQLVGHERGKSTSAKRYAKDRDADELSGVVNALQFDVLQDIAPFDVESGVAALKVASRRKLVLRKARLAKPTSR